MTVCVCVCFSSSYFFITLCCSRFPLQSGDDKAKEEADAVQELNTAKLIPELDEVVSECIKENGGSCPFDLIMHKVSKHLEGQKPEKIRNLLLMVLTRPGTHFKRDSKRTGWWINVPPSMLGMLSPSASMEDVSGKKKSGNERKKKEKKKNKRKKKDMKKKDMKKKDMKKKEKKKNEKKRSLTFGILCTTSS
jgi:hypothetical protein